MAKILIACEFSGTVRDTFSALGHDATSCDLEPTEKPGKHYQGNVLDIINDGWDLMIAHPPCTYLTVTGNKWLKDQPPRKSGALVGAERRAAREDAIKFFMLLAKAPIERIAIENPIGIMSSVWRKPDQIIQPYQFGHEASKSTCLWLKNLPLLQPTKIVGKGEFIEYKSGKRCSKWYADAAKETPEIRAKIRNRTFQGIADAMVNQWGDVISGNRKKCTFEGLVSSEKSGVHELMEFRIKNKAMLKKSMAFAVRVLSIIRERNISREELAGAISVSPEELSEILKGRENLTLETITKIETFFSEDIFQIKKTERL